MKFKILIFTLLIGAFSFAQKKEKIKGNNADLVINKGEKYTIECLLYSQNIPL